MASDPSVPVQIDSIKSYEGFQRTRCAYFRIELAEGPLAATYPAANEDQLQIATWGSWAVLSGPSKRVLDGDYFTSPESIELTLERVEETEGLFLDLGYVWLPNDLLGPQHRDGKARHGDVYRLTTELFHKCYLHVAGMIGNEEWLESCRSSPADAVRLSEEETEAFREWRRNRIARTSERYHSEAYSGLRLKRKDSAG
jgi:hypothetical protein